MEKFIPYEKLSKKKRRQVAAARRGSWGSLNPVTRKPENPKAYNRKKARKWSDESPITVPFDLFYFSRAYESQILRNLSTQIGI